MTIALFIKKQISADEPVGSTRQIGMVSPDKTNPALLNVILIFGNYIRVKDIQKFFGCVNYRYQHSILINDEEFVNDFQIVDWNTYEDIFIQI